MIPAGSLVVYVTPKGRRYIKRLEPGADWHSNDGSLLACDALAASYGDVITTNEGVPILLERPGLADLLMGIKRQTQIIYPKDIAWLCLKLGAGPGRRIIEAGCGSGAMTLALSWFCGADGLVVSHDMREEFLRLARRNLQWADMGANVEMHLRDVSAGFAARDADAIFLDMREPWTCLEHVPAAIKPGAPIAFLLPTTGQVSELLAALECGPFGNVEVQELLLRGWKPLADRLRPNDRMPAHTGFLIFCRQQPQSSLFASHKPRGTRERKQEAALAARAEAESK